VRVPDKIPIVLSFDLLQGGRRTNPLARARNTVQRQTARSHCWRGASAADLPSTTKTHHDTFYFTAPYKEVIELNPRIGTLFHLTDRDT
jgi:hypothetical protein